MSTKKYLIMTNTDNKFAKGVAMLLYSLQKHMTRFDETDVKVFYTNLSDDNKKLISKACPKAVFEKPSDFEFCKGVITLYGAENQDTFLNFEAFRQNEYEKVIYLNGDMLCIGDVSELLDHDKSMMVSLGINGRTNLSEFDLNSGTNYWNAGFFVAGRELLQDLSTYNRLVEMVYSERKKGRGKDSPLNDQDILNSYWSNRYLYALSDAYNFKNWGGLSGNDEILRKNKSFMDFFDQNINKIKIIHYSGKRKPWGNKTVRNDGLNGKYDVCSCGDHKAMLGVQAVDLWHQYYHECFDEVCETDWYHRK